MRRPSEVFYGWWIVAGGFTIQMLNGALLFHAFSAYVLPLQAEFGWNRTQLSGAFSMARAESGILGPIQGWLIDRYGPRRIMRIGTVLFAAGFFFFGRADSIYSFYGAFAVIALGSSLGGFMPITATVTSWFRRWRATALGLMLAGMGAGGLMLPGVVWLLNTHGWRAAAQGSALLILAVGLPATQLMRRRPPEVSGGTGESTNRHRLARSARRTHALPCRHRAPRSNAPRPHSAVSVRRLASPRQTSQTTGCRPSR
ncbi:MAG: MFS transporter [Gemmatimonadota bacterium]